MPYIEAAGKKSRQSRQTHAWLDCCAETADLRHHPSTDQAPWTQLSQLRVSDAPQRSIEGYFFRVPPPPEARQTRRRDSDNANGALASDAAEVSPCA